jgi:ureidoglycolate lyase
VEIDARDLTTPAFGAFGTVVAVPGRESEASGPGWRWWAETAFLPGSVRYGIGYLQLQPTPLAFDWAERHLATVEMIVPMGGDCVIYVAPPNPPDEIDRHPRLGDFGAFRVRPGQAVILNSGVWHGAPLTVEDNSAALVLLRENTGRDDVTVVRFPDTPVTIRT